MTINSRCSIIKTLSLIFSFLMIIGDGISYSQEKQEPKEEVKQESPKEEKKGDESKPFSLDINGYAYIKYRLRSTSGEKDSDLYEYLNFNIGNPQSDKISFSFYGRMTEDLDGNNNDKDGFHAFDNITDTFGSGVNGRLYHAYFTIRDVGFVFSISFLFFIL